jgi:hypothetical protein
MTEGRYAFRTIRPGPYPGDGPPAHIHDEIEAEGFARTVSEIMFTDCPRMSARIGRMAERHGFPVVEPERDGHGAWHVTGDFDLERGPPSLGHRDVDRETLRPRDDHPVARVDAGRPALTLPRGG